MYKKDSEIPKRKPTKEKDIIIYKTWIELVKLEQKSFEWNNFSILKTNIENSANS